ncbi:MAG: N-acetylmuramoyl-L-alanine amidase [Candidatus Binatus sp.]|uniref:N-acetylmuramoyl-L-alanine amidase family protein n=1 Tax=Candidatus Binatus sp. TaxID=2811406 RepID=UPI0027207EE0|nr:N-acetylmuramoyl-L-alanine amidase [Candidatus Binatus sp.]MDO8431411.1 N-acetylmuramoyl-L-alanine amidase [Candidatus Binatus sp.]
MRQWRVFAIAAAAILGSILPARASVNAPALISARIERQGATLELHFRFRGDVPPLRLSAHGSALWIDLGRTRIEIPPRPLFGHETSPIESVRAIDAGGGDARIVVGVEGKADYAIAKVKQEIVLRVAPAGANPNIAAPILVHEDAPRVPAVARASIKVAHDATRPRKQIMAAPVTPELRYGGPEIVRPRPAVIEALRVPANFDSNSSEKSEQPLVMIDPGHGGFDPGTQSAAGVDEKALALQISIALKAALEARGIRAALTRSIDVFISLPERTRIANKANADLFVSIHLNSSPNADTTGIEVYYLNNTTDHSTIRLARIENGGEGYGSGGGSNLNYILTDLRQNFKASEAVSIARMIDVQTVADLDAGLGVNVNALGAKMGPFYVLVGAHMPAVLVECGFMSNAGEAERLKSAQYQSILAGGIATAIAHYFKADMALGNL